MTPEIAAVRAASLEFAALLGVVHVHQAPASAAPPYAVVSVTTSEDVLAQGVRIGTMVRLRIDVLASETVHPASRPASWSRAVPGWTVDAVPVGAQAEAYEEGGRPWRRTVLEYSATVRPA